MSVHFLALIISIKNAYLHKLPFIFVNFNLKFLKILNLLYKEGLILSYSLENHAIKIYLANSFFIATTLKVISTKSNLYCLKYSLVCKLNSDINSFILFSTPVGYLTRLTIKQKKLGGILFLVS